MRRAPFLACPGRLSGRTLPLRPPASSQPARARSTSSLHLLQKTYQLPTVVLGQTPSQDVAALCARASESAFFRQGMPLVLDYSACDGADAPHVQDHLASLRAQHLLPVGVTNVNAPTATALASAGVPMLFAGGQGAARTAPRGRQAASAASARAQPRPKPPPQQPAPQQPAAAADAPPAAVAEMRVHHGSLRSGEQLYVRGSSVCVLGSVHSGGAAGPEAWPSHPALRRRPLSADTRVGRHLQPPQPHLGVSRRLTCVLPSLSAPQAPGAELLADGHIVVCGELSGRAFCGQARRPAGPAHPSPLPAPRPHGHGQRCICTASSALRPPPPPTEPVPPLPSPPLGGAARGADRDHRPLRRRARRGRGGALAPAPRPAPRRLLSCTSPAPRLHLGRISPASSPTTARQANSAPCRPHPPARHPITAGAPRCLPCAISRGQVYLVGEALPTSVRRDRPVRCPSACFRSQPRPAASFPGPPRRAAPRRAVTGLALPHLPTVPLRSAHASSHQVRPPPSLCPLTR